MMLLLKLGSIILTNIADPPKGFMMTPKIQAVIFDMDGVLVNSEPLLNAAAIAMFGEKRLVVQPDDFLPFIGAGEDRYIGGVAEKYQFPLDVPQALVVAWGATTILGSLFLVWTGFWRVPPPYVRGRWRLDVDSTF